MAVDIAPSSTLRTREERDRPIGRFILFGGRVVVILAALALWELAVRRELVSPLRASSPSRIAEFLAETVTTATFWIDVRATALATLLGFLLGSSAGIVSGILLARFRQIDAFLDPIFTFFNALPRIALAPLFLLWFGIGLTTEVVLAASLIYFIMLTSTRGAVKSVDPQLLMTARLLSGSNTDIVRTVTLPGSIPGVFAGLKLSLVYSLLGVIAAEMIASRAGLGQLLTFHSGTFNTAGVMGVLVILGTIGVLLNAFVTAVEKRLLGWEDH